jgi:tetratricopeptide (TPR) repeat protein
MSEDYLILIKPWRVFMPGERLPTEYRGREEAGECVSDELLFRYLDDAATPEEARVVQKHLLECKTCFDVVAALAKDSLHAPNEAEWVEFEKTVKPNPEKQIAGIMSRVNDLFQPSSRKVSERTEEPFVYKWAVLPMQSMGERLRRWFEVPKLAPRYALALAVLLVVIAGTYWGMRFYKTTYRIAQAERLLRENYKVYMADTPRLSGGYESKAIGILMADSESVAAESFYLHQVSALVKAAIASGAESAKAKQLLAQILIIKKNTPRPIRSLNNFNQVTKSAAVLNDLGVLYFGQEVWETAAQYFGAAMQADSQFVEARYNLALTKAKLGATDEAISILQDYINLETDEGWRNAAMVFRNKLEQQKQ